MANENSRKLFVAGLPDSITEEVLKQLFEATGGTVSEISLPKDRATGRPRGFGFVTLATSEQAQAARDSLDGSFQAGKSISVRPFQAEPPKREAGASGPRGGGQSSDRTLYVGNLPYDVTEAEVEALFPNAQDVVRIHLPLDADGRRRGFGFVTMNSVEGAREAVGHLQGAALRGRRLVVNLAHPKGERPAREASSGGNAYGGSFGNSYAPESGGYGFSEYGGGGGAKGPSDNHRRTFDNRRKGHHEDGGGRRRKNWNHEGRRGRFDYWDEDD